MTEQTEQKLLDQARQADELRGAPAGSPADTAVGVLCELPPPGEVR